MTFLAPTGAKKPSRAWTVEVGVCPLPQDDDNISSLMLLPAVSELSLFGNDAKIWMGPKDSGAG